jgi:hypothetical protein
VALTRFSKAVDGAVVLELSILQRGVVMERIYTGLDLVKEFVEDKMNSGDDIDRYTLRLVSLTPVEGFVEKCLSRTKTFEGKTDGT